MELQPNMKEWTKPELIVLVRSKPEEAVLTSCKGVNAAGGDQYAASCLRLCQNTCQVLTAS